MTYTTVPTATASSQNNNLDLVMSSTRSSHRVSATDVAPAAGATPRYRGGTSTRPRRHTTFTNSYLEISVDDDMMRTPECARETRETRSTRNAQMKAASPESDTFWTSGRPKRACIKRKRSSSDDKLISNNQSYYRVEVLNNKVKSNVIESAAANANSNSTTSKHNNETTYKDAVEIKTNSREQNGGGGSDRLPTHGDDKGLIVKFRRMRNSELKQLNNEAVNFLFPRKDDSSSEEDLDDNCPETTVSSGKAAEISVVISSEDDETVEEINETDTKEQIRSNKKKEEIDTDENQSLDSNWSDCHKKNHNNKRRRTHAEAFINDNQKYYKFETPGSRLRYQGTFMSTHDLNIEQQLRPRLNGEISIDTEDSVEYSGEDLEEKPSKKRLRLEDVKYSYELRPASEPWYQTFVRQDQGLENYNYHKSFSEPGHYKPFYLPHQLPPLQPLDPRVCFTAYDRLKRLILEEAGISPNPTPCSSTGNSTPTNNIQAAQNNTVTAPQQQLNGGQEEISAVQPDEDGKKSEINSVGGSGSEGGGASSGSNVASPLGVEGERDGSIVADLEEEASSNSNSSNSRGDGGSVSLPGDVVDGEVAGADTSKKDKIKDAKINVDAENTAIISKIDLEQRRQQRRRQKRLLKVGKVSGRSPGRNARKSPRQHASTLAILSLLQQRKRREMNRSKSDLDNSNTTDSNGLDPIQEDPTSTSQAHTLTKHSTSDPSPSTIEPQSAEAKELAKLVATIERMNAVIAAETGDITDFHVDVDVGSSETLLQSYSKTDAIAILEDYEKNKDVLSKTGLSHGANKRSYSPGKKPGRKRKKKRKNMTGWPNVVKKLSASNNFNKKDLDDSTVDSLSITADSEDLDDTNNVSLAALPGDSNDSIHLKFEVDEEYDIKMSLTALNRLQSHRSPSPSPKPPTNRNSRINSRSSIKSDKLCTKKCVKEVKSTNDASNYSSANNCVYNNASDNNIGTRNTSNNRVNVKEETFSENDMEDTEDFLSNCIDTNSKETKFIDLSHHWKDHVKPTRNSEINSSSETNSPQFQPVVRVEKLNNRQLRSSGVTSATKGALSNTVARSPTRSVSTTRSSTPGSPPRSLSSSRGGSKPRASTRRMPASPRSPRVLRKPRGRWYRER